MMYHFMLGLRGGSSAPATSGETFSPPAPASFFSSSCIESVLVVSNTFSSFPNSVMPEIAKHRVNPAPDYQVDRPEIRREQENRDDHNCRRGPDLLERGRSHLFHLGAHVV